MVRVEDAVVAKLKRENQNFEILVDLDLALKLRKGERVNVREALAAFNVFKDSKKGEVAPNLEKVFNTENIEDIAFEIIKHGEIQLTAEYKRKLVEEKKKQIAGMICQNAMDARTKLPIPLTRVMIAMDEAKVQIDHFKSAEEQMRIVVDKLRPILPISFENKKYTVIIPAQYSSQGYGILKRFGKITKENWLATGAIQADVEMPAGMSADFVDRLNKLTHGDIQIDEK